MLSQIAAEVSEGRGARLSHLESVDRLQSLPFIWLEIAYGPHCCLCTVVNSYFAKYSLHMHFHGRLGDVQFAGDMFIGRTLC